MICKYFLPVCNLSFQLLHRSFAERRVLVLVMSSVSPFSYMDCPFGIKSKNSSSSPKSQRFFSFICFLNFMILHLHLNL